MNRPPLDRKISARDFESFYWLKSELVDFCRLVGLSRTGGKIEISRRIVRFLNGDLEPTSRSPRPAGKSASRPMSNELTRATVIEQGWRCSEPLRAFFVAELGAEFHFNQVMRDFIKQGVGQTLQAAIDVWLTDRNSTTNNAKTIAPQFEYNRHFREYFQAHPNATRQQAIAAWHRVKAQRRTDRS